jgi:uncharacterized phiE125 gp8 family phage protein
MALVRITAPIAEPISLTETKLHLRVDAVDTTEDSTITGYIAAATAHLDGKDGRLGRCLVPQTWELVLDAFPSDGIEIPLPPLLSVTSITYVDTNGATQIVSTDDYEVDTANEPGWVMPGDAGWPSTLDTINAVRVRFRAGYEGDEDASPVGPTGVPAPIKLAMKQMVSHWFNVRETVAVGVSVADIPQTADMLLAPYRMYWVA